MATKTKALIGFRRMKDDELMVLTRTVIGAMTGNAKFLVPFPALDDVAELLDDFTTKLTAARKRGSPEDTALKDESKVPLAEALQQLGYYVNGIAKGHLSTLLSSGFPTAAPATGSIVPAMVEEVRISDGRQSGQVRLDFTNQIRMRLYEYTFRKLMVPEAEWSDRLTTTSSKGNIIVPLEMGLFYEFKVRALNNKGAGD
ncbi:hypothetical protein [Sphingobacterium sp. UBA6320]|jgi:hypothetical protein|uniref:hypothetical protein n=1 Tax=Sphingobacterium sp. UBA6320 TaxID=1947510 RepID=UPI0025E180A7|nr:hypothetical protein [Sphingobacterium sp. UBA6320]